MARSWNSERCRWRFPRRLAGALGFTLGIFALVANFESPARAEYGGELRDLYRGARMTAMGGAFVAIADDEQSLWVNPAGLKAIQGTRFHYATLDAEFSNDIAAEYLAGLPSLAALSSGNLNALIGKNIFARVQFTPTLMMPGWAVGIISDHQAAVVLRNQVFPVTTVGIQSTNGIQFGQAFSFSRNTRRGNWGELRIGYAAKMLWRRGGYYTLPLTQMLNLSQDYLLNLAGQYGFGYGVDLGMQYVRPIGTRLKLSFGAAYTNIGDIMFSSGADTQKGNLSAGLGAVYNTPGFDLTLAADYRNINVDTDWRKRTHLGFELGLPLVRVYGGLNQTLPTYGASMDIWLFKVTALTYLEARGENLGQDDERRWLLRMDAKFAF